MKFYSEGMNKNVCTTIRLGVPFGEAVVPLLGATFVLAVALLPANSHVKTLNIQNTVKIHRCNV
jgi:hypothetical protein